MADRPHLKGILGLHMLYLHLEYLFTGSYIGLKLKLSCPVLASLYTSGCIKLSPTATTEASVSKSVASANPLTNKMPERI